MSNTTFPASFPSPPPAAFSTPSPTTPTYSLTNPGDLSFTSNPPFPATEDVNSLNSTTTSPTAYSTVPSVTSSPDFSSTTLLPPFRVSETDAPQSGHTSSTHAAIYIAIGAVGALAVMAIIAGLYFFIRRQRRRTPTSGPRAIHPYVVIPPTSTQASSSRPTLSFLRRARRSSYKEGSRDTPMVTPVDTSPSIYSQPSGTGFTEERPTFVPIPEKHAPPPYSETL